MLPRAQGITKAVSDGIFGQPSRGRRLQNSRRAARELALKALFQIDVGGQPLGEVLAGAGAQVAASIAGPVKQATIEAQRELRDIAGERAQELSASASTQTVRLIKTTATLMAGEIRALAESVDTISKRLAELPADSPHGAEEEIAAAIDLTRASVHKLAARGIAEPVVLRELEAAAGSRIDQLLESTAKGMPALFETASFMRSLVNGTCEHRAEIDQQISDLSPAWALDRQAAVDRNILRLGAYEIIYAPDTPRNESINDAVRLAKKYSTAESGRFVNGVLGALAKKTTRAASEEE